MSARAPLVVLAGHLVLTLAAGAVLLHEGRRPEAAAARSREFQRLVGGLGFGPDLDLSRCAFGFDPRLAGRCQADLGPVPGGGPFCPDHACSILPYPPARAPR